MSYIVAFVLAGNETALRMAIKPKVTQFADDDEGEDGRR